MATSWVLGKISDALQPTIQSTVSSAGTFAGGALNTVGSGINGVGETINGTIKRYGDGVRDYGNGVMDWTNASGVRAQTASNPLGLNSGMTQGKRSVTSPSVYSAPSKPRPKQVAAKPATGAGKTTQAQKNPAALTSKKSPALVSKPLSPQVRKTSVVASTKPSTTRPATTPTAKPVAKQSTMTKPTTGLKTIAPSATKVKSISAVSPGKVNAANPLGLSV